MGPRSSAVLTQCSFAWRRRAQGQSGTVDLIALRSPQRPLLLVTLTELALAQPPLVHVEGGTLGTV